MGQHDVVQVFLDAERCEKVALEGLDQGPASIAWLFVEVEAPETAPEAPNVYEWFLLEVVTDLEPFSGWLGDWGLTPLSGMVEVSFSEDQTVDNGHLLMDVTQPSAGHYTIEGECGRILGPREYGFRYFFGPDPATDFWLVRHSYQDANGGAAVATLGEGTALSKLSGGATRLPASPSLMNTVFRGLSAPANDEAPNP